MQRFGFNPSSDKKIKDKTLNVKLGGVKIKLKIKETRTTPS